MAFRDQLHYFRPVSGSRKGSKGKTVQVRRYPRSCKLRYELFHLTATVSEREGRNNGVSQKTCQVHDPISMLSGERQEM
jgi:hypothetical protein